MSEVAFLQTKTAADLPVADHERVVSWHARTVVRLKDTLDHYGRYPPDISDEEFLAFKGCLYLREPHRGTINPYKFARKVIPFFGSQKEDGVRAAYRVPADQVIGESCHWLPDDLSLEQQSMVLQASERAMNEHLRGKGVPDELARYDLLEPFGLYIAYEGAHRAALYRQIVGATIPALVTKLSYPEPGRLSIHITPWNRLAVVLDERQIFPLGVITGILPLLEDYGVRIGPSWPKYLRCDQEEIEKWVSTQTCMDKEILPPIDGTVPERTGE